MDELTAYHEAGHAIVATLLGGRVHRVSIESEEQTLVGDTHVEWLTPETASREQAIRELRVSLAGPIAEMIHAGDYDVLRIRSEHSEDWRIALQCIGAATPSASRQIELLNRITSELYHLLRQDQMWAAVADLADQLLAHETIDYETVDEIVDQWIT